MADFAAFDKAVTAIRARNPGIAKAFDETRKLLAQEPPGPPPEPPAAGRIWAKPPVESPLITTIVPKSTRIIVTLDPTRDHIIRVPERITQPFGITLNGGRNRIIEGGLEITCDTQLQGGDTNTDRIYGLYLKNSTGITDIESYSAGGSSMGQAIVFDEGQGGTVQVQRFRWETLHPVSATVHTDGVQSWRGPKVLRLGRGTIRSSGMGLQLQPSQFERQALSKWEFRHLNITQTTASTYALFKQSGLGSWWPVLQENCWVQNLGFLAWTNGDEVGGVRRGIDGWTPGGNDARGVPALVEGAGWKLGAPPNGDFGKAATVGIGK